MAIATDNRRRPRGTLYRYLFRELTFPTLYTLGGLTLVVLTRDLLGLTELVIGRGLSAVDVGWIAFYKTVPLVAQTLPLAVLVGSLIGLGRLGADREILILEASGVSARRLTLPVVGFAAAFAALALSLSVWGAPAAERQLGHALQQLAEENPAATIRPNHVHRFGDTKLEARSVNARGDRMEAVMLHMPSLGETVFAKRGTVGPRPDGGNQLRLEEGVLVPNPRKRAREIRFDRMSVVLPGGDEPIRLEDAEPQDAMTLGQLAAIANAQPEAAPRSAAHRARLTWHRRLALPLSTLLFGFLVVPLFLTRGQFSRSGGGLLGLVAVIAYYGLTQFADGLIQAQFVPVGVGVWFPNGALLVLGGVLFARLASLSAFGRDSDRPRSREPQSIGRALSTRIHTRSLALPRYVVGRFLQMVLMCFGVLLLAYLLVDVLERLQWFAKYQATGSEVIRFYGARIPLLASRVVPMGLLVAVSLTVSLLAVQGELMGMRACGIPSGRAVLPMLLLCGVVSIFYAVLTNEVVPRTNALADYLKTTEIKGRDLDDARGLTSVWYRVGDHLYEAEQLDPGLGFARHITVYELGSAGLPKSRVDARRARHIGDGVWRLVDPVRVELGESGLRELPAAPFAKLGEDVPAEVDTMHLSAAQLEREIQEVEASGYPATRLRVDLEVKRAAPFACLVLPALALFFAVAGPPFPKPSHTLVVSAAVAVLHVLLTGAGASLGYGSTLPPLVAGWGPTLLFGAIAAVLGLRVRGFGQTF
ncbi:MAG: LptF/LptG family permease [Proteobacteria bacterium]|nr:LptF/LptG family permease [Pseudomonadota bacterium]